MGYSEIECIPKLQIERMNSIEKDGQGSANLDFALEAVGASDDGEFLTGEELTIDHIQRLSSKLKFDS